MPWRVCPSSQEMVKFLYWAGKITPNRIRVFFGLPPLQSPEMMGLPPIIITPEELAHADA